MVRVRIRHTRAGFVFSDIPAHLCELTTQEFLRRYLGLDGEMGLGLGYG